MNTLSFVLDLLSSAVIYALFGLAIVLAYRTSRVLMFCVGEIGMTSAYVLRSVWLWAGGTAGGLALAAAAALGVAALAGWGLYALLRRLSANGDHFVGTVVTIAASIFLEGLMSAVWNGETVQLPFPRGAVTLGGASLSIVSLGIVAAGGLLIAALLLAFYRTRAGIELQAVAGNWQLAVLSGIPAARWLAVAWIVAATVSAVAGIFSAAVSAVSASGAAVGFSGIVAAIMGGLTSPAGALAGAFMLAAGENVTSLYLDARYSVVVPVVLLVLLLALRPSGLSGRTERISRT
ncbi:branched-chain amino acid ABC transporter permease [Paraburkholderia lycopersici]|uniref:Branched-chain amino acid transport system permease protein n=1 Tax=Paraburkholderia lycopersici TaxID=416944 RepID=A0A1G6QBF6_9BURK|nr:branched-chain amino acid ABC transporter permease [Paraburkholderia lycopersici]SDC89699.1 branched-chain amino acid transport system permease protein [Paraburkholderia lycopersici]